MPRESVDYRDILERLDQTYPGREWITRKEIAAFLGVSTQTISNRYSRVFPARQRVTKVQVARVLSQ